LTVSNFELPNKSPSFLLLHSASNKLLNVHVPPSLDKQELEEFVPHITVLNDRGKNRVSQRIFDRKTKIRFHSRTGSAKTPRSHWELKSDLRTKNFGKIVCRMDTKEKEFSVRNIARPSNLNQGY